MISTFALPEEQSYDGMIGVVENNKMCANGMNKFWEIKTLQTPLKPFKKGKTYSLRYSKFGCHKGEKGSLVIAPGRTEASPEYYETAIDFINLGYSPVYVVDHRGQGLSPRLLQNTFKSHVSDFDEYISDFKEVVKMIQAELAIIDQKPTKLFYASNSMGGGIGMGYFEHMGKKNPFKAAILLGSMIRVNYLSFINKKPTVINNMIFSETGVIAQGGLFCLSKKKCNQYARGKVFGDYKVGSRVFEKKETVKEAEKFMTHSENRYNFKTFLWEDYNWSDLTLNLNSGEYFENPQLGGSTFSWTLTATKFLKKMRSRRFIKSLPSMPILILTGTNDFRAYKPYKDGSTDLSRHSKFCAKINKHNRHSKNLCTFRPLKGSFHEILKESDNYRNKAIEMMDSFYQGTQN
jgi:lysophospholipase